jgi:hypothetical protein
MAEVPKDKPIRKHLNAAEKRALKAGDIRLFVQEYGRRKPRGSYEPNDRGYDREIEETVRRMSPEQLDELMRDDEE